MKKFKKFLLIVTLAFAPIANACRMDDINFAIQSIRTYVEAHPRAADTLFAIHTYWIDWTEPDASVSCTFVALGHLEQEGFMERVRVENTEIYRRKRE